MKAANVEDIYPLSPMQQGILFEELSAPGSTSYNVQVMFVLSGELDADALGRTWELTVERHPLLRTSFHWKETGKALQVVRRRVPLPLVRMDWSGLPEAEQEARLREFMEEDRQRAFDLSSAPLMRLALIELGGDRHRLVWTHHHLLMDGWSLSALLAEVFSSYEALARGEHPQWEQPRPFRDYIAWLQRQDTARAEGFWRGYLRGFTAPTPLPLARPPAKSGPSGYARGHAECGVRLTREATDALQGLARTHRVTLNTVVQGAWALLLSRYSGSGEVVFGATVSGRPPELAGVERMLGLFINTLPVRARVGGGGRVGEWLRRLQESGAEARQYEYAPLAEVQRWGEVGGGRPLFDSVLAFMNYPVGKVLREHARLRVEKVESFQRTNFGLSLVVAPGSQLGLHLGYDTNSFEAAAAARVAGQLKGLLESIAADPEQRLSDLSLLTDEERRQLVFGWNDTARPFLRETCLHELFERQAALTPSAAAVVSGGERLTYAELDSRANRLANHLRAGGVGPETRVAILMERSAELVVSILGVLKAGGCYVPLDAQYPRERIAYTLDDSGASLILTQARLAGRLPGTAARVLKVDAEWERVARASGEKPAGGACSQNLVYVIYTSGSTGAPKGVMVSHRELVNYLVWCRGVFEVGEGHGSPIHAPVAFDGTKTSLFFPLTVGQSLLMIPEESGVEGLVESFRSGDRYSLVKLTPAHLDVLSQELSGAELEGRARTLIVGGEALWGENLRHWIRHAPGTRLIQEYGPTETTVSSCWYEIPRDESLSGAVPIGRPISNTQVFILDGAGNPAPVGATGEVYIGGAGLARGYWNRPALTAERFVPDPFSREAGARLYKTGDLAKFLPDGNVEFVGRADSQVKLRGFRVEPGEIEAVLCQHPSVAEAAVVVRTDGGGQKCLVAYVAGEQQTPPAAALREHLKAKLPEHMIPSAFVALDRLPLTPNGKVDRKALPAPAAADREAGRDYVAPRTPEEEIIAAIWQKVLGVRRVGITDNFLQLGGHSLLATQVMSRVRRALGVALPLRALFEAPTVRELAARATQARGAGGAAAKPLTAVRRDAPLPLSFAQQRLWFMHQLEGGSPFYNLPLAVRLGGRLNIAALRRSLDELVRRHESLRTTFSVTEAGQPLQVISPPARVPLPVIDLSGLAESACEAETRRLSAAEARLSFDLGRGPLLRCSLLRLGDEEHVALFTMHHVVSDAWSLGVLVREVAALYAAYAGGRESPLEELPVQYADYAAWQREWLRGEALERQLAYWRDQLAGAPPVLELPTDRPRPPVQTYRGALETFQLAPQLSEQLRELSRASGATLFMTLLAAFKVLLARYSRQDDITVGTVIAGRNREETEPLIGFFINTLVLRTHTAGDPSFVELLGRVRETCLGAYAHQDVPFEKLVEELRPERSLGRTPLFQVAFGVDNAPKSTLELPGLRLDILGGDHGAARFDLTLWVYEAGERLTGVWTYSTDLFDPPTIKRLSGHFEKLLQGVAADPEGRLSSFELVTEEERRLRAEEERRREEAHARRLLGVRRKAVTPGRETAA